MWNQTDVAGNKHIQLKKLVEVTFFISAINPNQRNQKKI